MSLSAPARLAPLTLTGLFWPTFLLLKLAEPPERLTSSPVIAPWRARPLIYAALVPSYSLFDTVTLPVAGFRVMSAVAVAT